MLNLRALPFGFEDREQIVCLVVETLTRLTVAGKKLNVTVNDLLCKIDAFMTDSVTKNLKVEEGVAETLIPNTSHITYYANRIPVKEWIPIIFHRCQILKDRLDFAN